MTYAPVKRVVVCADGAWYGSDGLTARRGGNNSNVYRIYSSVKQGTFVESHRAIKQIVRYETAFEYGKRPLDTFNITARTSQEACEDQVDRVFAFCCEQLGEVTDELWLYGFSCGAYVLSVVADLLHQLSRVYVWDEAEYHRRVDGLPSFQYSRERRQNAAKLFRYINAKAWAQQPVIRFMGLLDTIKAGKDSPRTQPALLDSTQALRHALALNETRSSFQPYTFGPLPALSPGLAQRSVIEAWFVGSHADMGGGARDDGLSLYPLQWMLLESRAHGLVLEPWWNNHSLTEEPLGLVFPSAPIADNPGQHEPLHPWMFRYRNGIVIEMVDLRSSHRHGNLQTTRRRPLQRVRSLTTGHTQIYPLTHTMSDSAHQTSWRSRFSIRRKQSRATLASAQSTRDPDVDSLFAPSSLGESIEFGPRPHAVQIHSSPSLMSLFPTPRQVFGSQGLIGYLPNIPCGTIIHPSVYFVCDVYDRLGIAGDLSPYLDDLNSFRQYSLLKHEMGGNIAMEPWRATFADLDRPGLMKKCRVLVCGRAGVGKSTLINKVFGTVVTQECHTEHGTHDVDEGFEMDTLPGLIIHDSKGFQSGATEELELLRKFVKKRTLAAKPEDRLDAIWVCIDIPSTRVVHEADKNICKILSKYARAVPVIIVRTMKDRFLNEHYGAAREQLEDAGYRGDELDQRARAQAEEDFRRIQEDDIRQVEQKLRLDMEHFPFVYTSKRDSNSIKELVKRTTILVTDDSVRANFVSAQIADVDLKVTASIEESLRLLNYSNWSSIMGSMMFTSLLTTPTISHFLCARIIKCFGLADSAKVSEIERIARGFLWKNMASFVTQSFTQLGVLLGLSVGMTMSTIVGGIPALASLPFAFIPPAARLISKCTCDLILVLCAAFGNKGKYVTRWDFEKSAAQYCNVIVSTGGEESRRKPSTSSSVRADVHAEIDKLIPIHTINVYQPLSVSKMRTEIQRIIANHRFTLEEDKETGVASPSPLPIPTSTEGVNDMREWRGKVATFCSTSTSTTPSWIELEPETNENNNNENVVTPLKYDTNTQQQKEPAELPGTTMTDPWNSGISELQGSEVEGVAWFIPPPPPTTSGRFEVR
ncbi:hypothetical protein GGS20DRAFT_384500 [Poronia punctata]|nr:hypothetical protein GGS20DRAFT_384500 [Poronia punctata]